MNAETILKFLIMTLRQRIRWIFRKYPGALLDREEFMYAYYTEYRGMETVFSKRQFLEFLGVGTRLKRELQECSEDRENTLKVYETVWSKELYSNLFPVGTETELEREVQKCLKEKEFVIYREQRC